MDGFRAEEFIVNPVFGKMAVRTLKEGAYISHLLGEVDRLRNHAMVYNDDYAFEIACDCLRRHLNGELDMKKYGMIEVVIKGPYRVVILYDIREYQFLAEHYFEEA